LRPVPRSLSGRRDRLRDRISNSRRRRARNFTTTSSGSSPTATAGNTLRCLQSAGCCSSEHAISIPPCQLRATPSRIEEEFQVNLFDRMSIASPQQRPAAARRSAWHPGSCRNRPTQMSELGDVQRGTLHVHASQTIVSCWLPRHLVTYRQRYPLAIGNTPMASVDGAFIIGPRMTVQNHGQGFQALRRERLGLRPPRRQRPR
jgi:hypothetical protein